jgi:nitronate monooxygenase
VPGLILLPRAAEVLKIPFIASGGFGNGRGLAAALALGADGINMGTRFMATREAPIHDNVKQQLVDGDELDTQLVYRQLRNTARIYKNSIAKEVAEIEREKGAAMKIEDVAHLVSGVKGKTVFEEGDLDLGIFSAGMVVGLIHDIPTVEELVTRIVAEAEEIIAGRLAAMLDGKRAAA